MPSENRVYFIGNITRDPELRYGPTGTAFASFGIAVNTRRGKGDDKKEEVLFQDVKAFGMIAENIATNGKKGSHVTVVGRLVTETWQDKTTHEKRSKNVVIADVALPGIWKVEAKTQPDPAQEAPPEDAPF